MVNKKTCVRAEQENLFHFSCSLDNLIEEQTTIFNAGLLNLLEQHFSYSKSAIIFYENGLSYSTRPICHNVNIELSNFYRYYQIIDPFSLFFISNPHLVAGERCVLRASDVLTEKELSGYRNLINELADIYHVLAMPFSTNVIITVYQSENEGDFTNSEVVVLDQISKMIDSRSRAFTSLTASIAKDKETLSISANRVKDQYLNQLDTGIIILDQDYHCIYKNAALSRYTAKNATEHLTEQHFKELCRKGKYVSNPNGDGSVTSFKSGGYNIKIQLLPCASPSYRGGYLYLISVEATLLKHKRNNPGDNAIIHQELFKEKYGLSDREMEVVLSLSSGKSYRMIAETLFISINTVRSHVKNIYRKLKVSNQRALLSLYNKHID